MHKFWAPKLLQMGLRMGNNNYNTVMHTITILLHCMFVTAGTQGTFLGDSTALTMLNQKENAIGAKIAPFSFFRVPLRHFPARGFKQTLQCI